MINCWNNVVLVLYSFPLFGCYFINLLMILDSFWNCNGGILRLKRFIYFQSRRKRPRTPTPGHYLGLKNTRDYGMFNMHFH